MSELPKCPHPEIHEAVHAEWRRSQPRERDEILDQWPDQDRAQEYRDWIESREAALAEEERQRDATQRRANKQKILNDSGLPARFRVRFSDLERAHCPAAYDAATGYIGAGWEWQGKSGLLLQGPPGTGKTTVCGAAIMEAIDREDGSYPTFANLSRWLQQARDSYGRQRNYDETEDGLLDLANNHWVVLDDLGRQRVTEWVAEALYTLIDTLYAEQAHVILTTNQTTEQLAHNLDEAILSRIAEMTAPVMLVGEDLRRG